MCGDVLCVAFDSSRGSIEVFLMKVDYATMDLARQLMERQADGHLSAMRGMISSWGTLSDSDLGLILQRLKPINDAIVHEGDKVLGKIEEVYSLGSSNMKATLEAYLRADEAAYCEVQKVASEMGVQLPTYKDPRDSFSSLGAAEQTAPPFYGWRGSGPSCSGFSGWLSIWNIRTRAAQPDPRPHWRDVFSGPRAAGDC